LKKNKQYIIDYKIKKPSKNMESKKVFHRVLIIWLFLSLIFSIFSYEAEAQINNYIMVGARPIGMGGAYAAVVSDANCIYWNPAGLPILQRQEITTMYGNLFGLGLKNSYLGYVLPVGDNHAFGIDWMHFGFGDNEFSYRQNKFNLSYGIRLFRSLSLGINGKFLDRDMSLDNTSRGSARGFGFDFGVLFSPLENLKLAITGNNIGGTSVKYDNDISEKIYPQRFRFGISYKPVEGLLFASDIDDRFHFGTEYWLFGSLALRIGIQKSLKKVSDYSRSLIYSGGISLKYRFLQFDYALENDPELSNTHRFSLTFSYNPSLVSIKNAFIKPVPIFRSLYKYYSEIEFGEIVVKNSSSRKLPVKVSIDIPTVTSEPYVENLVLDPQSTKAYPLNIALTDEVLASERAGYDNLVQPKVVITYEQDKRQKQTSRNLNPIYVLGKNKISWSDPARVAAFITPEDNEIDRFARTLIQRYNNVLISQFNNSNLGKAIILFDALGQHGIRYQVDRQTPWYKIAADSSIFDNIQFPAELLKSKIGDCDDCTVLFASLLENLGIQTVLLDVSAPGAGHIYMMFDSGIRPENVGEQPMEETEYVIYKDRVWIPVETTMYGMPFSDAWRNGALEYYKRKKEGYLNEIDISEAMRTYKPGQIPAQRIAIPSKEVVDQLLSIDIQNYSERLRQLAVASGVNLNDPEGLYDAGAAYLRFNRLDDAMNMFRKALELRPDFGDAINAIGVIFTKQRKYDLALQSFRRAQELLPDEAGIRVNIAIALYLQGKQSEAEKVFDEAVKMDENYKYIIDFIKRKK